MLPRWFTVVVAAEVAGVVVLGVLVGRMLLDGAHAAGEVIGWARPAVEAPPPPPPPVLAGVPAATPGPVTQRQLDQLGALSGPFLAHLDADTAATATGELRLVTALEDLIRGRVERAFDGAAGQR